KEDDRRVLLTQLRVLHVPRESHDSDSPRRVAALVVDLEDAADRVRSGQELPRERLGDDGDGFRAVPVVIVELPSRQQAPAHPVEVAGADLVEVGGLATDAGALDADILVPAVVPERREPHARDRRQSGYRADALEELAAELGAPLLRNVKARVVQLDDEEG